MPLLDDGLCPSCGASNGTARSHCRRCGLRLPHRPDAEPEGPHHLRFPHPALSQSGARQPPRPLVWRGGFTGSFRLAADSLRLVWRAPRMLLLPALAVGMPLATLAIIGYWVLSIAPHGLAFFVWLQNDLPWLAAVVILAFLPSLVVSSIARAGLLGAASLSLDNRPVGFLTGWAVAEDSFGRVVTWAFYDFGFRLVIGLASGLLGRALGRMVQLVGDLAWVTATYFVLPVMVFERMEPLKAVPRSIEYVSLGFEEIAGSNIILTVAFLPAGIVGLGVIGYGLWAFEFQGLGAWGAAILVIGVVILFIQGVLQAASSAVLKVALYRYAASGDFLPEVLADTFQQSEGAFGSKNEGVGLL